MEIYHAELLIGGDVSQYIELQLPCKLYYANIHMLVSAVTSTILDSDGKIKDEYFLVSDHDINADMVINYYHDSQSQKLQEGADVIQTIIINAR